MNLIDYLKHAFLTREQLLARCGLDGARLEELQRLAMMPQPSYRLRLELACDSVFGAHQEGHALDWYAHGYVAWAGLLETLEGPRQAYHVFADRYRRRLARLAAEGVLSAGDSLAADAHIATEWKHFLEGTYGLCTRSGLPEDIADKEAAIAVIREMTGSGSGQGLSDAQRHRLAAAVDLLDRASAAFAPHELARSSRRRYVDEVRAAYRL